MLIDFEFQNNERFSIVKSHLVRMAKLFTRRSAMSKEIADILAAFCS